MRLVYFSFHVLVLLSLFVSPCAFSATAAEPTPMDHDKLWNLQDADIISIINEVSQETGKNFVVDPRVQGKITLVSSKSIKPTEVYDVFLSILGLLGYSAIPNGNVIKIVPNIESTEMASRVATLQTPGQGDEVVVRVIPLEHVSAEQLLPSLRPLLPQWSNISAYTPGNILIVVGRASNLAHIIEIIKNVDGTAENDIEIVPLKHASATQITTVLTNLQNASHTTGVTPSVYIAADERSNSVLLSGNKASRLHMRSIISQLDKEHASNQGNTEVVYLRYLQAKTLAPLLGKIADNFLNKNNDKKAADSITQPSTTTASLPTTHTTSSPSEPDTSKEEPENFTNIQAETNTNAIIITAPPELLRTLKSIIAKLDIRPAQVLVQGVIVEIDEDDLRNLGITWGSVNKIQSDGGTFFESGRGFPPLGAGIVGIIPHSQIKAVLSALENKTGVDILSTPSIVVLDNQNAVLEVGKNIPEQNGSYATTGSTSTVTPYNTVERMPVTLKLTVTPQINLGCSVRLQIELKNDSLQDPDNPTLNPIINTSLIKNKVIVNSGDILVIGGLISNNIMQNNQSIPLLSNVPIVGQAFQNKGQKLEKKNLIAFISPIILRNDGESTSITQARYEAVRDAQIRWPENNTRMGEQKRRNILPPWHDSVELPTPFTGHA